MEPVFEVHVQKQQIVKPVPSVALCHQVGGPLYPPWQPQQSTKGPDPAASERTSVGAAKRAFASDGPTAPEARTSSKAGTTARVEPQQQPEPQQEQHQEHSAAPRSTQGSILEDLFRWLAAKLAGMLDAAKLAFEDPLQPGSRPAAWEAKLIQQEARRLQQQGTASGQEIRAERGAMLHGCTGAARGKEVQRQGTASGQKNHAERGAKLHGCTGAARGSKTDT
eukprot:498476-Pelagomonas_calceolata.AAC.2